MERHCAGFSRGADGIKKESTISRIRAGDEGGSLSRTLVRRRAPERILFCGWRRDMHDMIAVLDAFVYPGSELWLYNEVRDSC